ncbi:MAG: acyl-CoA dehydrogenase family protein [Acidobacteria bacterium]|nr:acyl-CoA dehydrogenase family protein [Acidobacteriota bacterium]
MEEKTLVKGGAFLLEEAPPEQVFTPEEFTDEHRMIAQTTEAFMKNELLPNAEEIEHQNFELVIDLLRKAGGLGLLSAGIPEKYGGLGLDKISGMLIMERLAGVGSYSAAHGAHTGIGTEPIVYFGTEEQKHRYLPKLATGEWIAAYALTEPEAGSDALAGKTRADLSPDGRHYILNGTKMWITNSSIANLFITFAKVNGEQFTAFIVERNSPGFTIGKEEKKMGIKGSSTCALNLDNVPVPVENVLGEIGKGHKIAFNSLNLGRLKLAAGCVGGCKLSFNSALQYAKDRRQFGKAIAEFGLIKHKLAEMVIQAWVHESMLYRVARLIDEALEGIDVDNTDAQMKAIEEYAVECAINKVMASEALDYVVDEMVQIFGGNGYSQEYPAERAYRDSRINRIFEGTNEINRLLTTGMLLRRAVKGELALIPAAKRLRDELLAFPALEEESDELLGAEKKIVANSKKVALFIAGTAMQKYMEALTDEQEIVGAISDTVMEIYAMESALLRTLKLVEARGEEANRLPIDITQTTISDAIERIEAAAKRALAAMSEGDELKMQLAALRRLTKHIPINTVAARRRIADAMIQAGRYTL